MTNARFYYRVFDKIKPMIAQGLTPPYFPGKPGALGEFLNNNLKYPDTSKAGGIVIIGFTVEIDGTLTGFRVAQSIGKDFDDEALRVLKISPKWVPAKRDGKPIKSTFTQPIQFYIMNK